MPLSGIMWAVQNVYIWFLHFPVSWTKTNTASIGDSLILVVRAMIFASIIQCCRWYYPQIKSPDCWLRALVQLVNTCCSVNIVIVSIRLTVAQETVKGVTIALWKSPRGSSSIKTESEMISSWTGKLVKGAQLKEETNRYRAFLWLSLYM